MTLENFETTETGIEARITDAPAPWTLHGRGYISILRFDPRQLDDDRFTPPSLRGRRAASPYALMMFVDYADSAVGPYHELLFIPGRFDFGAGRKCFSISRIFVSSMDSVVNGQRNWGIPKELAQFDVRSGESGVDRVRVTQSGQPLAALDYRRYPISIPVTTALLTKKLMTLGQHRDNQAFFYTPSARGTSQPAKLIRAESNPELFPDLTAARPLLSVYNPRFQMRFPLSRIEPLPAS